MTPESFLDGKVTLWAGDCLQELPRAEENSIDSVVCDPPYHLQSITKRFAKLGRTDKTRTTSGPHQRTARGFMNKIWDGGDVAFRVETWESVYRVMKPGAYLMAFSSTRTFGRMQVACEDAGFITHPLIAWIFGQGFPKATRVQHDDWEGWRYGTQSLKPAIEPIYFGQKPFEKGLTGTENVLKWGVGAINIDGCRIGEEVRSAAFTSFAPCHGNQLGAAGTAELRRGTQGKPKQYVGRWPANLIHDGSEEVVAAFPGSDGQQGFVRGTEPSECHNGVYSGPRSREGIEYAPRNDAGSAARFFYSAKADSDDRLGSKHPTVKPLDLMQYLVRLVTPPRGLVLDPFAGTGTTGEAAWREGFRSILIEREDEYQNDIRRRMKLCLAGPDERAREAIKEKTKDKPADHGPLFGGSEKTRGGADRFTDTSPTKTHHRSNRNDEVVTP